MLSACQRSIAPILLLAFASLLAAAQVSTETPAKRTAINGPVALAVDKDAHLFVVEELENLRKSGIQVVWPIPLLPSPDFSLAPGNHYQVEPRLGNLADFDALIDAVHHRGTIETVRISIVPLKECDWC